MSAEKGVQVQVSAIHPVFSGRLALACQVPASPLGSGFWVGVKDSRHYRRWAVVTKGRELPGSACSAMAC
jgi:hypothetical protein